MANGKTAKPKEIKPRQSTAKPKEAKQRELRASKRATGKAADVSDANLLDLYM